MEDLDNVHHRWMVGIPLPAQLVAELRGQLTAGAWRTGDQMPTEAALSKRFGLSRATVRQALKSLVAEGLVETRHGLGTFVLGGAQIAAGIEDLKSVTESISSNGRTAAVEYRSQALREASSDEAEVLSVRAGSSVLDIQVRILADEVPVAYSHDRLPSWVLPAGFKVGDLSGSVVAFLEKHGGPWSHHAAATVHAVHSDEVAWDGAYPGSHSFILFDQVVFEKGGRPIMHSMTYFVEGKFDFVVTRRKRGGD